MKSLYQFRMIAKSKEDGSYFTPDIIAFSARDLRSQAYALLPFGYKFVALVRSHPGSHTELNPLAYWGRAHEATADGSPA